MANLSPAASIILLLNNFANNKLKIACDASLSLFSIFFYLEKKCIYLFIFYTNILKSHIINIYLC